MAQANAESQGEVGAIYDDDGTSLTQIWPSTIGKIGEQLVEHSVVIPVAIDEPAPAVSRPSLRFPVHGRSAAYDNVAAYRSKPT